MPATTAKQQHFMGLCATAPEKARGKCPSKAVAKEFAHRPAGGYKLRRPKGERK